ncbi:MAG: FAD-binding oxidoreductase [Planctomycetaceae bacterium]
MSDVSTNVVLMPTTAKDVADAVCAAIAQGAKLSTSRDDADDDSTVRRVDLSNMAAVVDYPARDMTITVQGGLRVSELAAILAVEKQQLPLDCSDNTLTVAALVAGNTAGPRQFGYGTARDYLIGVEAVDGQGRIFHAGGRVVKNVAGYDLCRLLVGSRGSLGILTQLTFKLKPLPEHSLGIAFAFRDVDRLEATLNRLNTTAAAPVILDIAASPDDHTFVLRLAVEGTQEACQWQAEQLSTDCSEGSIVAFGDEAQGSVRDYCQNPASGWTDGAIRIQTLPSRVVTIARALNNAGCRVHGHAGNGILYVTGNPQQLRVDCEQLVAKYSGNVTDWQTDHPGKSTDALSVRLRRAFDPHSVFAK